MNVGTQLLAREGWRSLQANVRYYFIANIPREERVNLAFYSKTKRGYSTEIISLASKEFEEGLLSEQIAVDADSLSLPPWLYREINGELVTCEDWLAHGRRKHERIVDSRLEIIAQLLSIEREIRYSRSPEKYFTKVVNESHRALKYSRIKNWFYAYILHGKCRDALLPEFFANGMKSAGVCQKMGIKTGRKSSRLGKNSGFSSSREMTKGIIESFVKHSDMGRPMTKIYADSIVSHFGCKAFCNPATGFHEYYHPKGAKYPSFWQYKYRVLKEFGEESVAMRIYGPARAKASIKGDIGPFTESVGNLMERVEFDGYYTAERPRSMVGSDYLTKLCVVRAVDVVSGMILGVGFSIDSEVASAYEMCLFSMALDKVEFCQLFGLEIDEHAWPCKGMPAQEIFDRGPPIKLLEGLVDEEMPLAELTKSYCGVGKAVVESSHPKDMANQEAPSFIVSKLNYIEMIRREIKRVIADNLTSDASSRMTPRMISHGVLNFPLAIWNYLQGRGRTDAVGMKLNDAVERYLTKTDVSINRRGAFINGIRYGSQELVDTGIFDKAARGQKFTVSAYVLTACVRHIWIKVGGRLIFANAQLPIADDEEQLYLSLEDLKFLSDAQRRMKAAFKEHQLAASSAVRSEFERQVGLGWDDGHRRKGRARKTADVKQEVSDLKKVVNGK